ncbi:transposable element Tcb1 transposase [Trichonephila clavipes]|nr:transposable element Tcb1 transposase [Trichonephila clavipes]
MNGGHGQRNGTALRLLANPASACNITMVSQVLRHRGKRLLNSCVMHRHTGLVPGIIAWGGIGFHCRTPVSVHVAFTLNSLRYISETLETVVLPYIQHLPRAIFQHDNVRPHVARNVQELFSTNHIELIPWPACSPELLPSKNVSSMLAQ